MRLDVVYKLYYRGTLYSILCTTVIYLSTVFLTGSTAMRHASGLQVTDYH